MELIDYVEETKKGKHVAGFPPALEMPGEFLNQLHLLYTDGEKNGCEFGQTAFFRSNGKKIELSKTIKGTSVSCDPPRTSDNEELADMHSHPSASIGHVDGYSAPSLQDYLVFRHHMDKPLFIRFVSSGDWTYAVVYRKGLTVLAVQTITDKILDCNFEMREYQEKNMPGTFEDRDKELFAIENMPSKTLLTNTEFWLSCFTKQPSHFELDKRRSALRDLKMVEWKRQTPLLGSFLMEQSMGYNTEMANSGKFGFYCAKGSATLKLEAGPTSV